MAAALVILTGCGGLPRELRREITDASSKLQQTEKQFQRTSDEIRDDLGHSPDLFQSVAGEWRSRISAAKAKLDAAATDRRELEKLEKSGGKDATARVRQLLTDEDRLRREALDEANGIEAKAARWMDFQRSLPHYLARMREEHDAAHTADFAPVSRTVAKAEQDWPAKKFDLEKRLEDLKTAPERAEAQWQATEAARQAAADGKASGAQVATLIQADETIEASTRLSWEADQLNLLCGQLYFAWDKILDDLDVEHEGPETVYREKVKLVRTHFAEAGDRAPQTSTEERWVTASPAAYQAVENDLGMAIAHKDAGQYDSEAQNTAQPAGFAYIAPPSVGSNQYGYWSHDERGNSFWTFLPQYLIMRELFWGHSYRPIVVNEYNTYYTYAHSGRTWYGNESPAAAPKYGSHGTFTQQHYASSRYVQSGGFKNSAFASHASPQAAPSSPSSAPAGQRFGNASPDNGQGKRFGRPAGGGAPPSGKRFGGGGGARPAGKAFGGGHRR
jgi:hypothetical protein